MLILALNMSNSTLIQLLSQVGFALSKGGFNRQECYTTIQNLTTINPSLLVNPLLFYRDPHTGLLQNNVTSSNGPAVITYPACKAICGSAIFGIYPDATARLLTWLVPIILLVTNMQYAPISWKRFCMIPHLFGDPIDSTWSLLAKVETWNRCVVMARALYGAEGEDVRVTDVALIIAVIEEFVKHHALHGKTNSQIPQYIESSDPGPKDSHIDDVEGGSKGVNLRVTHISTSKSLAGTIQDISIADQSFQSNTYFSIDKTPFCSCLHPSLDHLYQDTARSIIDSRTTGTLQTIFSIGVYIVLSILAAFIPAFGGNSSPSGGKIATSILLSWVLPVILLSNIVGQWNSPRCCYGIVMGFKKRLEELGMRSTLHRAGCGGSRAMRWAREVDELDWGCNSTHLAETGAIYSFRISKDFPVLRSGSTSFQMPTRPWYLNILLIFSRLRVIRSRESTTTPPRLHGHWNLVFLSILPVCSSFIAAFVVLWSPPTYFSCRHVMIICIFLSWLLSALFSALVPRLSPPFSLSQKAQFNVILLKDVLLSSTILSLLISSASGLFNSCWCWTGWWTLRLSTSEPQVQLNPTGAFKENNKWIYPIVVGLALGTQLLWFLGMLWIGWEVYFGMIVRKKAWLWGVVLRERRAGIDTSLSI
jgi:hypothetical protein